MPKINLDKYYTPPHLAQYCIDKFNSLALDVSEFVEPSAGNGSFSLLVPNCIAYDIHPEHESITQADFLTLDIPYKKGRAIIGNPPFGDSFNLAKQFILKSFKIADYVAFILPSSQFDNNQTVFHFDLIHSEMLSHIFDNTRITCCFNIYKRPATGLNKKTNYKQLTEQYFSVMTTDNRRDVYDKFDSDITICAWGNKIGKEVEKNSMAKTLSVKVHDVTLKDRIIELIRSADWKYMYNMTASPNLVNWHVQKYLLTELGL